MQVNPSSSGGVFPGVQAPQHRRHFLQKSLALLGGTALTQHHLAHAIEPISRQFGPKFKFSLAAYSYRDLLTGKMPQLTLEDFIADCARMQLEGTELTSYYFPADPTPEYLRKLKELCFRLGLDVSGTAVGNDFCHPAGAERDKQLASVRTWIDRAEVLGAPVIRIFSGGVKPGQSIEEAERLAIEGIEESCAYAGQHGVTLALENHGGLTERPEGMLRIVKGVNSPWFGVNLDTGNFHGPDVYADLAQLAPYAVNVQIKVVVHSQGQPRQPADYSKLAALLRDANYRGYIVLEFEEAEDPRTACPVHIEKLRAAFA